MRRRSARRRCGTCLGLDPRICVGTATHSWTLSARNDLVDVRMCRPHQLCGMASTGRLAMVARLRNSAGLFGSCRIDNRELVKSGQPDQYWAKVSSVLGRVSNPGRPKGPRPRQLKAWTSRTRNKKASFMDSYGWHVSGWSLTGLTAGANLARMASGLAGKVCEFLAPNCPGSQVSD